MKFTTRASQRSSQFVGKALCLGLMWLMATACQAVFGDFEFDLSKLTVTCQSNTARCKDGKIQICANGDKWQLIEDCRSPDRCDLNQLKCGPCQPGSYQCDEAQPQVCGSDLKWSATLKPCASAALCKVADDGSIASCLPPGCEPAGALQCAGERLQRCPASLVGWEDIELCASAALCSLDAANAQVAANRFPTCVVPTCSPGQYNCDSGSPRPCNTDRNGWSDARSTCSGACNVAAGDCSPCSTGAYACSGAKLSHCSAEQTWTSVTCSSVLSCNSSALPMPACDPPLCSPGEFRCNFSALERCRSDGGKWEFVEQCFNGQLCNPKATHCEVPACPVAGAKRCKGNEFQECREDLTRWEQKTPCPASGSCDPASGCLPVLCTEDSYRCNDVALEQCIHSSWTRKDTCKTTELCDATQHTCIAPTCAPGDRQCVGAILQRCNRAQNGWEEIETCKSVCSPETKRCEPG